MAILPESSTVWHCQVIIGSYPHGDGTFDKANDFQSVVVDGSWRTPIATAKLHAGQVSYVVPAAKGNNALQNFRPRCRALIGSMDPDCSRWGDKQALSIATFLVP